MLTKTFEFEKRFSNSTKDFKYRQKITIKIDILKKRKIF